MHLIDLYQKYTEACGGSLLWRTWSFIGVLSAVLERRVWRCDFSKNTYPNLYLILCGPKGTGKTFASDTAMKLLHKLNSRLKAKAHSPIALAPGKVTPAALIRSLQRSKREIRLQDINELYTYQSLFSYAPELSSFIVDIGGGGLLNDLLEFYDCHDIFTKSIVKDEEPIEIINVSFGCLWDTTPEFLQRFLPNEHTQEGLTSRIITVMDSANYEFKRTLPRPDIGLEVRIIDALEQMTKLIGEMKESKDAREFLDDWNDNIWNVEKKRVNDSSLFGVYEDYIYRKNLHVNKLAMILAATRGSLTITIDDAKYALSLLEDVEKTMRQYDTTIKRFICGNESIKYILAELPIEGEGINEDDILQNLYHNKGILADHNLLDSVLVMLKRAGVVSFTTKDGKRLVKKRNENI